MVLIGVVLSNNTFFDGRPVRWRKERWAERRKALQAAGRLSRVKRERGRERRWLGDVNKLSRQIVDQAKREGKAIALERLGGICQRTHQRSKRFHRMMLGWNFRELADFIEYKATLAGVPVVWVDPRGTSTTCPRCGHTSRANRRSQGWFRCVQRGCQSDADRVGALSVAAKGVMLVGQVPTREGSVAPLKARGRLLQNDAAQANLPLSASGSRRL